MDENLTKDTNRNQETNEQKESSIPEDRIDFYNSQAFIDAKLPIKS